MFKSSFIIYFILICIFIILYKLYYKAPNNPIIKTNVVLKDGTKKNLKNLNLGVAVVSYFQSWCGDCRRELPELIALQEAVGGANKLSIVLISDESRDKINTVENLVTSGKIQFLQSSEKLSSIGIKRFPTTYLIDKNGKILDVKVEGIYWNTPETIKIINQINQ